MGEQGHPELECGLGSWDSDMYGNHRILVRAPSGGPVFGAELPWRRRDPDPAAVDVIVLAPSGRRVRNTVPIEVTAGHGRIAFEPVEGEGDYAVHYLPYAHTGRPYYPQAAYRQPTPTADPGWVHRCGLQRPERVWATLPRAEAFRYEAVSAVDSFAPMGFAATAGECAALTAAHPDEPLPAVRRGPRPSARPVRRAARPLGGRRAVRAVLGFGGAGRVLCAADRGVRGAGAGGGPYRGPRAALSGPVAHHRRHRCTRAAVRESNRHRRGSRTRALVRPGRPGGHGARYVRGRDRCTRRRRRRAGAAAADHRGSADRHRPRRRGSGTAGPAALAGLDARPGRRGRPAVHPGEGGRTPAGDPRPGGRDRPRRAAAAAHLLVHLGGDRHATDRSAICWPGR